MTSESRHVRVSPGANDSTMSLVGGRPAKYVGNGANPLNDAEA
ncbi:Uncharacterised protein [Mycobacterium tuberculosis]|nr:Uncharacterised protein [Mycobacterium tuberculosis]